MITTTNRIEKKDWGEKDREHRIRIIIMKKGK